jgi:hypothetical protein
MPVLPLAIVGFAIGLPIATILFWVGFGDVFLPVGEETKEGFSRE